MADAAANTEPPRPRTEQGVARSDSTETADVRLARLRHAAELTGREYAEECVRVVFDDLRDTYDSPARLIMHRGLDDDGDTDITLLAVRDPNEALLWWRDCYAEHPDVLRTGRARPARDLHDDQVVQLELLLQDAYDQRGQRVLDSAAESDHNGLPTFLPWNLLDAYQPAPVPVALDVITWKEPPVTHQPQAPTRDEVKAALAARPAEPAIVARHDRAARARAHVERIRGGQEYGPGHLAVHVQVGGEHRVYAMCAPPGGLDEQTTAVWCPDLSL